MVFKLIRTDTAEPCKIQLPLGKHLIGRGKLLDCEDKRVSRNHGELEVIDDKVSIKALHQNPCFIVKKGTAETQILKQNCESDISNGDKFGLLPDCYWYELLHCVDIDNETGAQPSATEPAKHEQNEDPNCEDTEPMNNDNGDANDNSEILDLNLNEMNDNNIPGSPSILESLSEQATQRYSQQESPEKDKDTSEQNIQGLEDNIVDEEQRKDTEGAKSPSKRCHTPEDDPSDVVKRIKTEPEIKQDPDDPQAGPSSNQVGSTSNDDDKKPIQLPPTPALRERCMYGANCYRRNPVHKAQFSHPADADWGAGAQAACPYGAACRKRDARHWRDHAHPPAAAPPPPPPRLHHPHNDAGKKKTKARPKRMDTSDVDDDDALAPGLIIQGKRVRKTVRRVDNWSGSESDKEEDPYGTDESDEWQPTTDMTDSQLYSQDV